MAAYCEVALPVPLDRTFTYGVRLGQRTLRGARVIAPFRNEKLIGVVTAVDIKAPADVEVKYLEAVLDEEPLLSDRLLELAEWTAQYYLAPLGEVLRAMLPLWFPRVNEILRLIGSHNVFATPTAAQMADKDLRPLIDRYLPGAKGMAAEERIRIFRLVWDFAGSALASRNEQYERFYLASSPRNLARHHGFTDRSRADRLVERFMKEPY